MTDILSLRADKDLELNGVEVNFPEWKCKFKICRAGNKRYSDLYKKRMSEFTEYQGVNNYADAPQHVKDQVERAVVEIYAETILVGWEKGVLKKDGKPFEYSLENAIELLGEDNDFFSDVSIVAGNKNSFRKKIIKESAENLEKASSGN